MFYQRIQMEKQTQGYSVTYISVRRDKLLKDGYHQLGLLSNTALKGTIKVKFVNAQVKPTHKAVFLIHFLECSDWFSRLMS